MTLTAAVIPFLLINSTDTTTVDTTTADTTTSTVNAIGKLNIKINNG